MNEKHYQKALAEAQVKIASLQRQALQISGSINEADDANDHRCDCEYCDLADAQLSESEMEKLETEHATLNNEIETLQLSIKRMTNYKSYAEKIGIA